MNFIKKVFDEKPDRLTHLQFQKFSRGEFKSRAQINVKNLGGKYKISTSHEFANDLVRILAEKLKGNKTKVTGAIISTNDLTGKIKFESKKQFQGVKSYIINNEMSGYEILGVLDNSPKSFFALCFKVLDSELKIKPKAPLSGKPKIKSTQKEGEEKKEVPDFCRLVTTDKKIAESFVFEKPEFKNAEIIHTFLIKEIIIPEALKKEKDFAKMREEAIRKGKIIREAEIDGKKIVSEKEFEI